MSAAPNFTPDDPERNAHELCRLFQLSEESAVPVHKVAILSDGIHTITTVDSTDKYRIALLLMYLWRRFIGVDHNAAFRTTREMRDIIRRYFGHEIIADATSDRTKHETVRLLLGTSVTVLLQFQPNYRPHR